MTPATPPRSRNRRSARAGTNSKGFISPTTPHRLEEFENLLTPATSTRHKPVVLEKLRSPIRGLKTPEYTPAKLPSKRRLDAAKGEDGFGSVSRVLFPTQNSSTTPQLTSSTESGTNRDSAPQLLLAEAPALHYSKCTGLEVSSVLEKQQDTKDVHSTIKISKQTPGTPSDKIVTFEMANDWNNNSGSRFSSDEEGEEVDHQIRKTQLENPFESNDYADRETRSRRQKALLASDPQLKDKITCRDRLGNIVKERRLTKEEQEQFKPKALFTKELERRGNKDE
ncbi:LAMI_0G17546g1_1 [Lachancea mirantina]|uniref:LAMI_0G17546g1_1 n=1 Tax=Lachancea mirantina TaxID=1230905 RepID=A0A1G4KCU6_9SACH|nr:LAMI_0G17546g1_1 [Lachancea mirantina]